jgi:nitrous oxide reductase accessory protein NosL
MPKSGTLNIKVCRDMWTSPDEDEFYPANRGTYSIILSAVGDMSADASASFKIA